jgi:sulfate permease, SulP family
MSSASAACRASHHLVAGPDAPIAALIGSLLGALAATTDPAYVQLGYAQAIVCGLVFFGFWWFRLGFLANFLSKAVTVGFVSSLGIEVFTSQLQKILGVKVEGEGYFRELFALIQAIPSVNLYALGIGVGTIVVIRLLKRVAPAVPGAQGQPGATPVRWVVLDASAITDVDSTGADALEQTLDTFVRRM